MQFKNYELVFFGFTALIILSNTFRSSSIVWISLCAILIYTIYKIVVSEKVEIALELTILIYKKFKKYLQQVLVLSFLMIFWQFAADPSDWFFYLVCILLFLWLLLKIAIKTLTVSGGLILILLVILILTGLFDSQWWTGIALCSNLFLLLWSEDILPLIGNEYSDDYKVPFELKRKILKMKVNILIGNICIYFSLVISEDILKTGFVENLIKNVQINKDYILKFVNNKFIPTITLGVIRIIIFMVLFVIVLIIFKLIRRKSKLISEIEQDMKTTV